MGLGIDRGEEIRKHKLAKETDAKHGYPDYTDDVKEDLYKKKYLRLRQKMKQEKKKENMRSLQEDFDHYLEFLALSYSKVQQNSIHPKIFNVGLSGALAKAMATTIVATLISIVRFFFNFD